MGAMYVDDLDMYTWKDEITDPLELMLQAQQEVCDCVEYSAHKK